jgi:hypothetical protein
MIENLFKSLDIIAPQPALYIQGETRYKTIFGGLLSILVGFLSILSLLAFGLDIIQKKRPMVYNSRQLILNNILTRDQTEFIFGAMFSSSLSISNLDMKLIFYLIVTDTDVDRDTNTTITTNYPLIPCNTTNVYTNNFNDIQSQLFGDHGNYYCLPSNLKEDIRGKFGNAKHVYYDFRVGWCRNPENLTDFCGNNVNKLFAEMQMFYVHFLYLDYDVDLTNYDNPFKTIWSSDLIQLSGYTKRTDEYFYKIVNIQDDAGWILEDFKDTHIYQFDHKAAMTQALDGIDVLQVKVSISNLTDNYSRKYVKIQEIFANTGGFIKFILLFVSFFSEFYSDRCFLNFILNKTLSKDKIFQSIVSFDNRRLGEFNTTLSPMKPGISVPDKKQYCIVNPKLSIKHIVYPCFKENKKNIVLNNLNYMYKKTIDIYSIMKYLYRFNLMEQIIFGKEGQSCLKILQHNDLLAKLEKFDEGKVKEKFVMMDRYKVFLKEKQRTGQIDIWKNFLQRFRLHASYHPEETNFLQINK